MTNRWGLTIEERDAEVLGSLDERWVKPIDIGGQDCSHHSSTLARLVKQGKVERKIWGGYTRPSYQYRLRHFVALSKSVRCESDVDFIRQGRRYMGQCLNKTLHPSRLCHQHR